MKYHCLDSLRCAVVTESLKYYAKPLVPRFSLISGLLSLTRSDAMCGQCVIAKERITRNFHCNTWISCQEKIAHFLKRKSSIRFANTGDSCASKASTNNIEFS